MTGNRDIHLVAGETRDGYRWVVSASRGGQREYDDEDAVDRRVAA